MKLPPVSALLQTKNKTHSAYTSWIATLKSDLSLHNLTFEDAIELAMDKPLWRLLVASGATH